MKLFQHKSLNGTILITSCARYESTPGFKRQGAGYTVATFDNGGMGSDAYDCFKLGLTLLADDRAAGEVSLYDEETGAFVINATASAPARGASRNYIYGIRRSTGEPVWARNIDGVIDWSSEAPTPDQDVMDGGMGDEYRALYVEIKTESENVIRDITSLNVSGGNTSIAPKHPNA